MAGTTGRDRPRRRRPVYDDDRLLVAQRLATVHQRRAPPWARQQALLLLAGFAAYFPNAMFQDVAIIPMAHAILFFMAGMSEGIAYQVRVAEPRQACSEAWLRPAESTPAEAVACA